MSEFESKGRKIFVGGISWDTTDAGFTNFFSRFGEIKDAIVMRDRLTGASRGFGFVTFAEPSSVAKVLAQELKLDGRVVDCKIAIPKGQVSGGKRAHRTKKIFVGGLSSKTTVEEFREHFSQFGNVADAVIMIDHDSGRSRGFGFITFDSEETVEDVMRRVHAITDKQVECKKALPKAKMMEQKMERVGGNQATAQLVYASYGTYGNNLYTTPGTAYGYDTGYEAYYQIPTYRYGGDPYTETTYPALQRSRSVGSTYGAYPSYAFATSSPPYETDELPFTLAEYATGYESAPTYATTGSYDLYGTSAYVPVPATRATSYRIPTTYTVYDDGVSVL